jgi:hypothetical protein
VGVIGTSKYSILFKIILQDAEKVDEIQITIIFLKLQSFAFNSVA